VTASDTAGRGRGEEGVTLLELALTMLLLGVVMAMLSQVMISVQTTVQREEGRSDRNDRLRLALFAIERDVRSGEVVADPALENDVANGIVPGMSARIRTYVGGSVTSATRCRQWRIHDGQLARRDWSPRWRVDADVKGWQVVAEGIVNSDVSPSVAAFTMSTNASFGGRVVEVRLLARPARSPETKVQELETALTGRNAVPGAPATECNDVPPYP
jgi:type II secretory pathway component PulJ